MDRRIFNAKSVTGLGASSSNDARADIIPNPGSTYSLGTSAYRWLNIFANNIVTESLATITATITAALQVFGNATFASSVVIQQNLTVLGTLALSGITTLASLTVNGLATLLRLTVTNGAVFSALPSGTGGVGRYPVKIKNHEGQALQVRNDDDTLDVFLINSNETLTEFNTPAEFSVKSTGIQRYFTNDVERFKITPSGTVAISTPGTPSPLIKLFVTGSTSLDNLEIRNDAAVSGAFTVVGGNTNLNNLIVNGTIFSFGDMFVPSLECGGTALISGAATLQSSLAVTGATNLQSKLVVAEGTVGQYPVTIKSNADLALRVRNETDTADVLKISSSGTLTEFDTPAPLTMKSTGIQRYFTNGVERLKITTDGTVAIGIPGTPPPSVYKLLVSGLTGLTSLEAFSNATIGGNLTVGGTLAVAGDATAKNITLAEYVDTGSIRTNSILCIGVASVGGTLGVTGATTLTGAAALQSTLAVTGATTLTGAAALQSTLAVTGATTLTGAATLQNTLAVTGATTLTGAATLQNTLAVNGATTLQSNLTVNGTTNLQVLTSERLRVGTASNTYKCEIGGPLRVGQGFSDPSALGNTGSIILSGIRTTPITTTAPVLYHKDLVGLGLSSDYAIDFAVNGGVSSQVAMKISNTQTVQIGTTDSGYRLSLGGPNSLFCQNIASSGRISSSSCVTNQLFCRGNSLVLPFTTGTYNLAAVQVVNSIIVCQAGGGSPVTLQFPSYSDIAAYCNPIIDGAAGTLVQFRTKLYNRSGNTVIISMGAGVDYYFTVATNNLPNASGSILDWAYTVGSGTIYCLKLNI